MFTTGIDIIEIDRIEDAVIRWGRRFLQRIYTQKELDYCHGRIPSLAALFSGKEAVIKALGIGATGIGWIGISWHEIEILPDNLGKPLVHLHDNALKRAQELNLGELAISLSHSKEYAVASVMGGTE